MYTDFWVWTISLSRWRYARDMGITLIDITVKSGVQTFAPTWENLRAYKAGVMSKEDYAQAYYEKVLQSFQKNQQDWKYLLVNHNVAFACYCRPGDFCHRYFFVPLAIAYLQSEGKKVEFKGELVPNVKNLRFYEPNSA